MAAVHRQRFEQMIRRMTPVSAPPEQHAGVLKLSQALDVIARSSKGRAPACKLVGPKGEPISVPASVFFVFERVAEVLARGEAVTIVPVGKQLTTQQAADLLNVSRQYLVRLLDEERIPFTKTGKHPSLRVDDVLAFKQKRDTDRRSALRDLTRLTEDLGGYDSEPR